MINVVIYHCKLPATGVRRFDFPQGDLPVIRILAIDIGNTRASFARFENRSLLWRRDVSTSHFPELAREILTDHVDACVVSNVSKNRAFFDEWIITRFKDHTFCIDPSNYPYNIQYSPVDSLGHDRLANAIAAHELAPQGAIVIDLGTATHFDVIAPDGSFLGGPILSGLETMLNALTERIPHLPEINLDTNHVNPLSQNTCDAINAGTILCAAGGIDRITDEIQKNLNFVPTRLLTGGNAPILAPHIHYERLIPNLTLSGLAIYAEIMLKKSGWMRRSA